MNEMISAPSVTFSMTPFVWNTDAAVFVFKDGKANIDRENLVPGKPIKVVLIGDRPNEAQVETIRLVWETLKDEFGFAAAGFCPAIQPLLSEILPPAA